MPGAVLRFILLPLLFNSQKNSFRKVLISSFQRTATGSTRETNSSRLGSRSESGRCREADCPSWDPRELLNRATRDPSSSPHRDARIAAKAEARRRGRTLPLSPFHTCALRWGLFSPKFTAWLVQVQEVRKGQREAELTHTPAENTLATAHYPDGSACPPTELLDYTSQNAPNPLFSVQQSRPQGVWTTLPRMPQEERP